MARKKMSIEPAVQTMVFLIPESTSPHYLDLSASASVINRRFYRQGLNWAVSGFTLIAPTSTSGQVTVSKLPNTWVVSNSWEKGFRAWRRQQDEALEAGDQQSVKGRFNDFKIYADEEHFTSAIPHFILPQDASGGLFDPPDEWLYSEVVVPNDLLTPGLTIEYRLKMMGADSGVGNCKSLIKAYADSRSVPQSPDPSTPGTASVGLYTSMFNVGNNDSEVVSNAEFRNDELPYNQDQYPGSELNAPGLELVNRINLNVGSTVPGKYILGGSNFPCGIVKINNSSDANLELIVHLVPGSHRGYLAESMTEM